MPKKKNKIQNVPDHEINDVLTVFKADWDIVEDRRVRNELGVLVSQDNNWVITDPQIVMALQYGNPNYPPYSIGNEYVSVSEKNEVADSWVNRTAEAWYKSASGGYLAFHKPSLFQRISAVWIVMIAVSVVFVIVYGIAPFVVEPKVVERPQSIQSPSEQLEPLRFNYLGTPVPNEPLPSGVPVPSGDPSPGG